MQEYYKSEISSENKIKKDEKVLDAKTAREMTNNAIINLIKNEVFPKIAEKANKGESSYSFSINRNIDYNVGIEYLKELGYAVRVEFTSSSSVSVYLKW